MIRIITFSALLLSVAGTCSGKDWRGIVPLKSTRADVERLLGPSGDPVLSIYYLSNEIVSVEYSEYSCNQTPKVEGWPVPPSVQWNVPPGTVIAIRVAPRKEVPLNSLSIDFKSFKRVRGDKDRPTHFFYVNEEEGFAVEVFADPEGRDEIVRSYVYQPGIKDNALRCPAEPFTITNAHTTDAYLVPA
jgi:hypothetical protein